VEPSNGTASRAGVATKNRHQRAQPLPSALDGGSETSQFDWRNLLVSPCPLRHFVVALGGGLFAEGTIGGLILSVEVGPFGFM
jgi:hypothetical protein